MICHPFLGSEYSDAAAVRQALQALPHQLSLVIGGQQTPASLWLLVTEHFPQASHWLCTESSPSGIEDISWLKRGTPVQLFNSAPKPDHHASPNSNAAMPDISATEQRAASVKVAPATPIQQAVTPAPSRPTSEPAHANGCAAWPDSKLIRETFILSAWGDTPESTRLLQAI